MRLVFINRFYWPDTPATGQLLTDLAEFLVRAGHDVTVIASQPETKRSFADSGQAARIERIGGTRWSRHGLFGKAADWGTFYLGALWRLFRIAHRQTIVIALTDPPLLGLGASFVTRLRGARLIHWVQDIYPELAIELAGQRWLRLLIAARDRAWCRAERCVTLGAEMAAVLASAGVPASRIAVIPNWAPRGLTPQERHATSTLRRDWGLEGKFVVAYSGNLGRVHDLEPVLAVAEILRDEPGVAFIFLGGGAQREHLQQLAVARSLTNVSFHPSQPRDDLAASLGAADLHFVTLRPGCERLVFPSKFYGIAAVGRPVFFIGPKDCELARLIRDHDLGSTAERGDIRVIAQSIRRLQSDAVAWQRHADAAARFASDHNFAVAAAQWQALLAAVGACGPAPLAVRTLLA